MHMTLSLTDPFTFPTHLHNCQREELFCATQADDVGSGVDQPLRQFAGHRGRSGVHPQSQVDLKRLGRLGLS